MIGRWLAAAALLACGTARAAEPVVWKMATVAPEGTGWAREIHNFARQVEQLTGGALKVKLYFNGVAGDEMEMGERLQRGQLDAAASGHMLCEKVAPAMRVLRLPGVFQSRAEATDVMNRLQPTLEAESARSGMVIAGTTGLGPDVIFSRTPVRSIADLRRLKLWRWNLDEVGIATSRAMGLQVVATALPEASRAYDDGRIDGFLAIPAAALAFQWTTQARYVTDLRGSWLYGCVMFSEKSYQKLTAEQQLQVGVASAQIRVRMDEYGRRTDEALLGGLFQKQGVQVVPVSESLRAEYFSAARAARDKVLDKLVPTALVERVLRLLADYRAEHSGQN